MMVLNNAFPTPSLHLAHPTAEEKLATWNLNSIDWGSALSTSDYINREQYLATVPLAKNGGKTYWILVDEKLSANARPLLASCETIRKRALISHNGVVRDVTTHGISSVFCNPKYRGNGYASRMMKQLGVKLRTWQTDKTIAGRGTCAFSILYSDIGKSFYAAHGWRAFPGTHIALPPVRGQPDTANRLGYTDIPELCALDEKYIREALEKVSDGKTHVALIPDHDTMQWHHLREDFLCHHLFKRKPETKGAIMGEGGSRVWAIWTRSFYGPIDPASGNTLHILRVVVEDGVDSKENAEKLKGVLEIAQAEAEAWKLLHVEIWNPTSLLKSLVQRTELEHAEAERDLRSIPSLMWYGDDGGTTDDIEWVGNEKYGWC